MSKDCKFLLKAYLLHTYLSIEIKICKIKSWPIYNNFFFLLAVRFGRMPKTEREKLMADKEEMTNNRSGYVIELRTLSDVIKKAFRQNLSPIIENFKNQQEKVNF